MLHPEVTASATATEAEEVRARTFDAYVSSNRTCEIGLQQGIGRPYRSVVQLVEESLRSG
jgi:D-lactate dehydrogenase